MTFFSARGHSKMDIEKTVSYQLLEGTIGIPIIEIVSNNFEETPGYEGSVNTYQEIVFQIKEEEPDIYAIGVLYALSLMSFTYAAPRGYSDKYFVPDEQWNLTEPSLIRPFLSIFSAVES